jgi:hypothetical protein
MPIVPIHVQRRIEQRWASLVSLYRLRQTRQRMLERKPHHQRVAAPGKNQRKTRRSGRRALTCHRPDDATFGATCAAPLQWAMPRTIPNPLLHDEPVPLASMRSLGRTHVLVCCSNPDCHHNAETDARGFSATPDALHRVRSSRRRRQPVVAASWLIGPGDRGPLVHRHVGLFQPIDKR